MSRSQFRYTTSEVPQIDVRELVREGSVRPGMHTLKFAGQPNTNLAWTACTAGGQRPWFLCPTCGKRYAILYQFRGTLGCRSCFGIYYDTQRAGAGRKRISHLNTMQAIRVRLGGTGNVMVPFPARPKGMHVRTYYRKWTQYSAAEKKHVAAYSSFFKSRKLAEGGPLDVTS